jgi:hypothetical protein
MIFIIDDFLSDPYKIRNYALNKLNYTTDKNYIVSGKRNIFNGDDNTNTSNLILKKIQDITGACNRTINCGFHLNSQLDYCGNIHVDARKTHYAAVLYLTPDPKPDSGTRIFQSGYQYKWRGEQKFLQRIKNFNKSNKFFIDRAKYSWHTRKYEKQFGIGMDVENRFNRLVVYKSTLAHKALYFFGDNKFNSRLTFFGFFN